MSISVGFFWIKKVSLESRNIPCPTGRHKGHAAYLRQSRADCRPVRQGILFCEFAGERWGAQRAPAGVPPEQRRGAAYECGHRLAGEQFRWYRLAFCAPLRGAGSLPVTERICPNGTGRHSAPEPERADRHPAFSTWTGTSRPSSSFIISARKPPMRLQSG